MKHNAQGICNAIAAALADDDEALTITQTRAMEYESGWEAIGFSPLAYYSSSGTGTPPINRIIARYENLQAESWADQYPLRPSLFDCIRLGPSGEYYDESCEWLDAALDDECIYLTLEVKNDGSILAGFTDRVMAPLWGWFKFEWTPDCDLDALCESVVVQIYYDKESNT